MKSWITESAVQGSLSSGGLHAVGASASTPLRSIGDGAMNQLECQPCTPFPVMQPNAQFANNSGPRHTSSSTADIMTSTRIIPSSLQVQSWTDNHDSNIAGRNTRPDIANPHKAPSAGQVSGCAIINLSEKGVVLSFSGRRCVLSV